MQEQDMPVGVGRFFLDDDPMIRELLRESCPEEYQVLGEAGSCQEAREILPQLISFKGVVVAILDGWLLDGSGREIAQELKAARKDIFTVSFSGDRQDWADANFIKGVSLNGFWRDVDELAWQVANQ